jgi:hypothetical protein
MTGPIGPIGYRAIRWDGSENFTSPAHKNFIWPKNGLVEAACHYEHTAPSAKCTCGIYVVTDILIAVGYGKGKRDDKSFMSRIMTLVECCGKVIDDREKGWRTEQAQILALVACDLYGRPINSNNHMAAGYDLLYGAQEYFLDDLPIITVDSANHIIETQHIRVNQAIANGQIEALEWEAE